MKTLRTDIFHQDLTDQTAEDLRGIVRSVSEGEQLDLSSQDVNSIVDKVSRIIPAGSVPGVILSGLARLRGREISRDKVDRDMAMMFDGIKRVMDRATYLGVFAGPAAAIWAYQNMLKLVGKNPEDAFPDGTWQFYTEYALREDTARHANETNGFDAILEAHDMVLSPVDRLTCWVLAAIHALHQYNDLLENEWRERVYTNLLIQVTKDLPDAYRYTRLYSHWRNSVPYYRGQDVGFEETYPDYRRRKFDEYLRKSIQDLPEDLHQEWLGWIAVAERDELPNYLNQMTLLAYLVPDQHRERRELIDLKTARIGVVYKDSYYLIPVCDHRGRAASLKSVRQQIAAIFNYSHKEQSSPLVSLVEIQRSALADFLAGSTNPELRKLELLQTVPILINANCDQHDVSRPLSQARRVERGIGSHGLTLIDTGKTMIFDQSHIFFDGAWGAAVAEILTNEALSWGVYIYTLKPEIPEVRPPFSLRIKLTQEDRAEIVKKPKITAEACAESEAVNIKAILALRKIFKRRSDLIQLTVNDLLILYRAIHVRKYKPSDELLNKLQDFARGAPPNSLELRALKALKDSWELQGQNPSILIPVDASIYSPRERVHPLSFEVPLSDLNLLSLHERVVNALDRYKQGIGDRQSAYTEFDQLQREYLTTLAGFGGVLNKAKRIAAMGETTSVGTIKLLAHIPPAIQRFLDEFSGQFDLLNDIIKGREVFSNVGAVVPSSTLTRFLSAKDDNEKKTLVWGVLTSADGKTYLTLRDFHPHVQLFVDAGYQNLANQIAQDYLDHFTLGLNAFVRDLRRITVTSRETRLAGTGQLGYYEY